MRHGLLKYPGLVPKPRMPSDTYILAKKSEEISPWLADHFSDGFPRQVGWWLSARINRSGHLGRRYSATPPAISHFGVGVLTFHVNAVITTPPGVAIYATGPANNPKHGISPLSGIIETDWLPFTFTMNWRMTVKNEWVYFEKDEPFCLFYPIRLDMGMAGLISANSTNLT